MINQQCPACGKAPKILTPHGTMDRISDRTQVKRLYPESRRGNRFDGQYALMMGNKSGNEMYSPNVTPESESGYIHPISDLNTTVENVCHNIYNEPNVCGNINTANCCEHSTVASYTNVLPCENSTIQYRTRQILIETKIKTNRRGLFLLLFFIMLLFLSNVIGLPLVYAYASKEKSFEDNCFECEQLPVFTKEHLTAFNISRSEDGTCCVQSTARALILLLKGSPNQEDVERNYELLNKVLARKRSAIQVKGRGVSKNKIVFKDCDMKLGHLSFDSEGIQISIGGTYSLYSSVHFKKGSCLKRRVLGYRVRATGANGQTLTLTSVHHSCLNGTNFEQDFSSQTIFQVPLGQTWKVFIEILEGNKDLLQQHHNHSMSVFEI